MITRCRFWREVSSRVHIPPPRHPCISMDSHEISRWREQVSSPEPMPRLAGSLQVRAAVATSAMLYTLAGLPTDRGTAHPVHAKSGLAFLVATTGLRLSFGLAGRARRAGPGDAGDVGRAVSAGVNRADASVGHTGTCSRSRIWSGSRVPRCREPGETTAQGSSAVRVPLLAQTGRTSAAPSA
jgi:hypothetical protein